MNMAGEEKIEFRRGEVWVQGESRTLQAIRPYSKTSDMVWIDGEVLDAVLVIPDMTYIYLKDKRYFKISTKIDEFTAAKDNELVTRTSDGMVSQCYKIYGTADSYGITSAAFDGRKLHSVSIHSTAVFVHRMEDWFLPMKINGEIEMR